MRKGILALALLSSCKAVPGRHAVPGDALVIMGKLRGGALGFSRSDLMALPRRSVRGVDPHGGGQASYSGAALAPLLTEQLPLQPGADVALFHGAGGYEVAIPLNAIRLERPVLATERDGQEIGAASSPGEAPLLAWPDAELPGLDTDPRLRWWWVRGVRRIELTGWVEGRGKALRVPAGASDGARRGAALYADECMQCHRIRGEGGRVGPELTGLAAPADARRLGELLRGHLAARSGIASAEDLPPARVEEVAAFLAAVRASGAAEGAGEGAAAAPVR